MSDAKEDARTLREADGYDEDRDVLEFIRQSYRGDGSSKELRQKRALWRTYRRLLPDDPREPPTTLKKKAETLEDRYAERKKALDNQERREEEVEKLTDRLDDFEEESGINPDTPFNDYLDAPNDYRDPHEAFVGLDKYEDGLVVYSLDSWIKYQEGDATTTTGRPEHVQVDGLRYFGLEETWADVRAVLARGRQETEEKVERLQEETRKAEWKLYLAHCVLSEHEYGYVRTWEELFQDALPDSGPGADWLTPEEMQKRIEEASEEQEDLALFGLEIYDDTAHGRITHLFQAMFKDNRVGNLVSGDTWEAVRDGLGPLRVKKGKRGKPPHEEAKQLLEATLNLWRRVENQSD